VLTADSKVADADAEPPASFDSFARDFASLDTAVDKAETAADKPAHALRRYTTAVVNAVTGRLRPEEVLFSVFGVALVILVLCTGQVDIVSHRLIASWRFVAIVLGVALVIFARAYRRAATPEHARSAEPTWRALWLDRGRARVGRIVAVRTMREFGPLFACLAIYEALHDLTPILRPIVEDHLLVSADHAVFGVDVGRWLDDHIGSVFLTQVLTLCYVSYAFASPIYAGIQYYRGRFRAFHDFALGITITAFIGYTGYLLLPAVGPYLFQHGVYPTPLPGWGRGGLLDAISNLKGSARDAFPSLHTAMTTVVLVSMWRDARKLFWAYLPVGLGLYLSTMYLRVHYATDVVAGFVTAAIALCVAPRINRWWYARRDHREMSRGLPRPRLASRDETLVGALVGRARGD
jgi:membrane-associated phospholipid phosphatase